MTTKSKNSIDDVDNSSPDFVFIGNTTSSGGLSAAQNIGTPFWIGDPLRGSYTLAPNSASGGSGGGQNMDTPLWTGGPSWGSYTLAPNSASGGVVSQLADRLDKIEERLGILRLNQNLEDKWEKLKRLGDEYRKLERDILEGEEIWETLKK